MPSIACPAGLDAEKLREAVLDTYTRVALQPRGEFHFNRGPAYAAAQLGYDPEELASLPELCTEPFAGVGNPLAIAALEPGETVVEVGSGAGMDLLLAARRIGPRGRAVGVDMTDAMIARCRRAAREAGLENVEIRQGYADALPVPDGTADVVISNGVLNLVPDKGAAFRELFRVLRPGGRLQIADIAVESPLADDVRGNFEVWAACIGGALAIGDFLEALSGAGFEGVRVVDGFDPFLGSSKERTARLHGVRGVNVFGSRPAL